MISCTEFIPAYSELFAYIEEKAGRSAVDDFWEYLFKPTGSGIPLINHINKEGIKGCFTYWMGSLNEEAADFSMYLNENAGWFMIKMHRCPSKGKLIELGKERGFTPYHDYCLHCDYYRNAVEKIGLKYLFNTVGTDHASCSIIIYDPKKFDGRIIIDDNTVIMDRRASDNEYFHPDFHSSMNMGIDYIGEKFGLNAVREYLEKYTVNVYGNLIADIRKNGIKELEKEIKSTYEKEKATEVLEITCKGNNLHVKIKYCPAVSYLKNSGREISKWYKYTTETVMEVLAAKTGYKFKMCFYDESTGAAEYLFEL